MPKTLGLVADPVVVAETVESTGPDVAERLRATGTSGPTSRRSLPARNCASCPSAPRISPTSMDGTP